MPTKRDRTPKLVCPCCGVSRGQQAKQALLDIESECQRHKVNAWWGSEGWSVQAATSGSLQWACPTCLKRSLALPGKPWLQRWCDFSPYFAFFDVKLTCEDCNNEFVFSAYEQQFWYEKLQFWVQSRPKQCQECRKAQRQIKQATGKRISSRSPIKKKLSINTQFLANLDFCHLARIYF